MLALSKSRNSTTSDFFGVVKLGNGPVYSTSATSYTPDGTELAIFDVSSSTKVHYYYISNYFRGFNCGVNKKTLDRFDGSQIATIAF